MTSTAPATLTTAQLAALKYYAKSATSRSGRKPHTNTNIRLKEWGYVAWSKPANGMPGVGHITAAGTKRLTSGK